MPAAGRMTCRLMGEGLDVIALSVVVPCYNESENIQHLYERVTAACRDAVDDSYEFILVDDGSRDDTWRLIEQLCDRDPHVTALNLSRNFGHQVALTAGLYHTRGERIFILDADLQDPPELLGEMMAKMDEGADVVYGQRLTRESGRWLKEQATLLFYRLLDLVSEVPIHKDTGDFRLVNRRILDIFLAMPEQARFIRGMMSWIGFRQVAVQYHRDPRFAGQPKYTLAKLVRLALDGFIGFSTRPLRMAVYLGLILSFMSMLGVVWALAGWAAGLAVPGWTSLAILVMVLGGAQMLALGIIGEYVGRIHMEIKRRPHFLIDRSRNWHGEDERPGVALEVGGRPRRRAAAPDGRPHLETVPADRQAHP